MVMISSLSNSKVKYVRRLQLDKRFRHREQVFVAEGTRWLNEILDHPQALIQLYYVDDWINAADNRAILAQVNGGGQSVSHEVMKAMSATETPPGVLAVVAMRLQQLPEFPTLAVILDAITDPGNLGTILRTAVATGVDAVLLAPGCVDIYNPKVIRSAMGAQLRLPCQQMNWQEITTYLSGIQVYLAAGDGKLIYTSVDWNQPSALIIGNEAHGGGQAAQNLAAQSVFIPMQKGAESLNAGVAASVFLFEAVRQKRLAKQA